MDRAKVEKNEKLDYIRTSLQLYDFTAQYRESVLDGKVPGVAFKLRNLGDKALSLVEVTVYFKDSNGIVIAEETYHPVLVSGFNLENSRPLKPSYIWQLERGQFYAAKKVPSEWKEGAAVATITDIEFAKSATN